MLLIKRQRQIIGILLAISLMISSVFTGTSQGDANHAGAQDGAAWVEERGGEQSSHYQRVNYAFAKEDYRLEESSARILQKVIPLRQKKCTDTGRRRLLYSCPSQNFQIYQEHIQNQYILKSKSIIRIHSIITEYIHRKDGEKVSRLF